MESARESQRKAVIGITDAQACNAPLPTPWVVTRHQPIPVQGAWLAQVVSGFFNYYAVPINTRALSAFRDRVVELWRRSLRRRSQRDLTTWERMKKLATDWLPRRRILHPWPSERFAVKHPRWEPSARIGPARFCAGGAQQSASLPRSLGVPTLR